MMQRELSESLDVIGAVIDPTGPAPFAAGPLVLRARGASEILIVNRFLAESRVEVQVRSAEAWRGLLDASHALELTASLPAIPGGFAWRLSAALGQHVAAERDLRAASAWVTSQDLRNGGALLIVTLPAAVGVRARWKQQAFDDAWRALVEGQLDLAQARAEEADCLAPDLEVNPLALLTVIYEARGRKTRAERDIDTARRSRGERFYREVIEKRDRFRRDLNSVAARNPSPALADMRRTAQLGLEQNVAHLGTPSR